MKNFVNEFKAFIARGNVLDLAIGVVIGGAFGKITSSLVNDILMPLIAWLFGTRDMTALNIIVRPELVENGEVMQEAIIIGFGALVATIIDFLLIALVIFFIVKLSNKAHNMMEKKKEEEVAAVEEAKPTSEELLAEILEELKKR